MFMIPTKTFANQNNLPHCKVIGICTHDNTDRIGQNGCIGHIKLSSSDIVGNPTKSQYANFYFVDQIDFIDEKPIEYQ